MDLTRHLTNLYYLVHVIDAGGFSAAARELGTTRSLLSRRIIELETALDKRLLFRDARRFAVTPMGEQVYRHAILMCDAANTAVSAAHDALDGNHGPLRVGLPASLMPLISPVLAKFAGSYPQVRLSTSSDNDYDTLLRQHTDAALHLGHGLPDNGDIIVHPLGQVRLVIVANPSLLQRLKYPQTPDDVEPQHRLVYTGHGQKHDQESTWVLSNARSDQHEARLVSDQIAPLITAACAGTGFVQLPLYSCHDELASGQLQTAFEAFEPPPLPLHVLTVSGDTSGKNASTLIDFLRDQLADIQERGVLPM